MPDTTLKLRLLSYFLRSMDHNLKLEISLTDLSNALGISSGLLNKLLSLLCKEEVIAFNRFAVNEKQETTYLFSLKPNTQTQELILLYQTCGEKQHARGYYGKN